MERIEIAEKLKEVLQMAMGDSIDFDSCTEDSNLVTDLGLNSVGILYVVIAVEEFFGIRFDDVTFGDFNTVSDVIDYISKKVD